MDRVAFNAMLAQYATPEVSGGGRVSWDRGVRCVMPSVKLYGKCEQGTLTGKNLFNVDWIVEQINAGNFATDGVAYEKTVEIPIENGTYVLSVHNRISDKGTCILSVNKAVNSTSSGAVGLSPTFSDYNAVTVENGALYIGCNSSVENFIYLIQNCMVQIEVGGKLTAYEPYCGGIHAPNPYYPMPVKSNNGVFAARGSNLFNIVGRGRGDLVSSSQNQQFSGDKYYYRVSSNNYYKNEDFSVGDVQIDPENNSVSLQTKYSGYGLGFDFKTLPNKTYRLMAEVTGVCLIGVSFYTPGGTHISWVNITSLPSTFTTPDGTGWMVIIFRPYLDRGTYYNIRLTCGEEAAYTPYYDGGQAMAPELYAIPGTEYRDEWDAQTGQGVRRCAIIESYAGEAITTPYISSTGELSEGATVIYGIPDTPFVATPARLTMPPGAGQIIQVGGDVADCPITARYLTHS